MVARVGIEARVDEEVIVEVPLAPSPLSFFVVGVKTPEDEPIALDVPLPNKETEPDAPFDREDDSVAVEQRDAPEVLVWVGAERAVASALWLEVPILVAVLAILPLDTPEGVATLDSLGKVLGKEAPEFVEVAEGSPERVGK